jgi:predicted nucleic-acid-binding Zn-ribbon protein
MFLQNESKVSMLVDPECSKCGSTKGFGAPKYKEDVLHVLFGMHINTYLERECNVCGYKKREKCKDDM